MKAEMQLQAMAQANRPNDLIITATIGLYLVGYRPSLCHGPNQANYAGSV